jgi:Lipoprotein LpqB beta-propeller domain/Sporulation and spore germination
MNDRSGCRSRAWPGVVACAAVLALAGCAMVPGSGPVNVLPISQAAQNQGNPQLIPIGPVAGWTPTQIVNGFLAASASFASDPSIALEYLTPTERKKWHPGAAVTVVGNLHTPNQANVPARQLNLVPALNKPSSGQMATVQVEGAQVATLTETGQYLVSLAPAAAKPYTFVLQKVGTQWRINQTPTSELMLTTDELERAYQLRNLYFLDPSGQTLVPDPVFVPQNATDSGLATQLVRGLLKDPQGWLSGATRTAFPAGTKQPSQVKINGPDAIVSLTMPPAAVKSLSLRLPRLAAQLFWTLTGSSYGPSAIQTVQLQINGHTVGQDRNQYLLAKTYQNWIPRPPTTVEPYFISSQGPVRMVNGTLKLGSVTSLSSRPVAGQAGTAGVPALSAIAVAPNQAELAGISANGRTIYIGVLARNAPLAAQGSPGGIVTSLSWDRSGTLWFVAGGSVWMLRPGTGPRAQVNLGLSAGDDVTAFRVAPDGVRVAMIVKNASGATALILAAIVHTGGAAAASLGPTVTIGAGVPSPERALSWYDADHIIVLAGSGSGAQLYEVPVNGGQSSLSGTQSGTVSVSGDGAGLAVGLSNEQLFVSPSLNAPWEPVSGTGSAPVFPG